MNDVELRETYELSSVLYPVRWGVPKTKYRALIILIDTEANCQIKFEQITKYLVDESLKQKIQKKPTAKQSELSAKTNREACQIEMLESQISNQAIKIKDLDETVSHQLRQIKNLESKNREITEREKIKEKDIDHCNRQALMSIATCIFNNYGTQSEVQNLLLMQPEEEKEKSTVIFSSNF